MRFDTMTGHWTINDYFYVSVSLCRRLVINRLGIHGLIDHF